MLVYFVHFFSRRRCLDFHLSLIACLLFCTLLSQFLFGHFCCHCSSIQLSLTLMTAISILLYHKNWAHYYHYTFSFFFLYLFLFFGFWWCCRCLVVGVFYTLQTRTIFRPLPKQSSFFFCCYFLLYNMILVILE